MAIAFAASAWPQADNKTGRKVPPVDVELQQPIHVSDKPLLHDGLEIPLRLTERIKPGKVHAGDKVDFVLYHDLYWRDVLLARAGTPVEARVTEARGAKVGSRGSRLAIEMGGLKLLNGQFLPLRGYERYDGSGAGVAQSVAGGMVEKSLDEGCILCEFVFVPVALISLAAPGSSRDVKIDTSAAAFVDRDYSLDLESFKPFQPQSPAQPAKVRIVRGHLGWPYGRDLYCNGMPLAHFEANHRIELELQPGFYRFAVEPSDDYYETYLSPGTETELIASYQQVTRMKANDKDINTSTPFRKHTAEELMRNAKPVAAKDIYPTMCAPLVENKLP